MRAALAARTAARQAEAAGLYSEDEHETFLLQQGVWCPEDAESLTRLEKEIESLKIKLCELWGREGETRAVRLLLAEARERAYALRAKRATHSDLTVDGHAAVARARCLVGLCLLRSDATTPVWAAGDYIRSRDRLLDAAVQAAQRARPGEAELREVARTEPWRTVWVSRHGEPSVFGRPAAELTDEQKQLLAWSRVYDNVREDPECPPEDLMADDDAFDGWLLLRRNKSRDGKPGELSKASKAATVFIVNAPKGEVSGVTTPEEIARVAAMNSEEAASLKARRAAFLQQKGAAQEAEFPDSREKILAQFHAERRGV